MKRAEWKGRGGGEMETRFYELVLDEAERGLLEDAARIEGLDREIAVLRLRILRRLATDGAEGLDTADVELLIKAVRARYAIARRDAEDLTEAVAGVLAHFEAVMAAAEEAPRVVG
jgi:hypothetical protein